ncbi:unnamed protein product [Calicophoron daubneyi]|uniref:Cadherin domain-containing protein n=1 Tax=Calicophoron daubneyi TaxID=300641 RepID=A0AAV2TRU5_CALDB
MSGIMKKYPYQIVSLNLITLLLPLLLVVLLTASNAQSNILQVDNPHAIQSVIEVSESTPASRIVIDMKKVLLDHGYLIHAADKRTKDRPKKTQFEILDVSANLLSPFHTQRPLNFFRTVGVDSNTGEIRFKVPLDRERLCPDLQGSSRKCTVHLLIAAHDLDKMPANWSGSDTVMQGSTVYIDLTVVVTDENDNAPYFLKPTNDDGTTRTIVIPEESPIGAMFSLPIASDPDSPENGVTGYEFHPIATSLNVRRHFEVVQFVGPSIQCEKISPDYANVSKNDHSGEHSYPIVPCLRVISRVDREENTNFVFRLVAVDSAKQQGETIIRIVVVDLNDHAPEWSEKLEVFDSDGRSHFMIADLNHVSHTGQQAERVTNQSTTQRQYSLRLKECTKPRKLLRLTAEDLDDPDTPNGRVTYQLSEQSPDIENLRRRIFISNNHLYLTDLGLKGLSQTNFSLLISASDLAGKSSNALIRIQIEDCNDHPPLIITSNDEFVLLENSGGKITTLGLITVRDMDVANSVNSMFDCFLNDSTYLSLTEVIKGPTPAAEHQNSMQDSNLVDADSKLAQSGLFRRGRWSVYKLETVDSVSFDRELTPSYSVLLQCSDKGSPSLTSHKMITVNVLDVNDNAPEFINHNKQSHESRLYFHTGSLQTRKQIVDYNRQSGVSSVFEFRIPENTERGTYVGTVYAVDRDMGENGQITFGLQKITNSSATNDSAEDILSKEGAESLQDEPLGEDVNNLFTVSTSGDIHLLGKLDRELKNRYSLLVIAKDNGKEIQRTSTATIIVHVEDVNDCRPVFAENYVFEVVESYGSSTIHHVLGTLNATDADQGRNGSVSYRLATEEDRRLAQYQGAADRENFPQTFQKPSGEQLIKISHDGQVTIYGVVDREQTPVIVADVVAEDSGIPNRLFSITTITIHVLDLNDNKPSFVAQVSEDSRRTKFDALPKPGGKSRPLLSGVSAWDPVYKLNLSLETSVGSELFKFEAVDPDDGPNGTVVFDLIYAEGSVNSPQPVVYQGDDETSANKTTPPTFTLHTDGRLLLSKELSFERTFSSVERRRYRRPDRLLIQASDQGPKPERAIAGLQIVYFDPIRRKVEQWLPSLTGQEGISSRKFDEKQAETEGSLKALNAASGMNYKSHAMNRDHANRVTAEKSVLQSTPRIGGFPVLYLLALAVCFALILVITSLVYLYIRTKRSGPSVSSSNYYGPSGKLENVCGNRTDMNGTLADISLKRTPQNHCNSGSPELRSLMDSKSPTLMDISSSTMEGRKLSPPYMLLDRTEGNSYTGLNTTDGIRASRPWTNLVECQRYCQAPAHPAPLDQYFTLSNAVNNGCTLMKANPMKNPRLPDFRTICNRGIVKADSLGMSVYSEKSSTVTCVKNMQTNHSHSPTTRIHSSPLSEPIANRHPQEILLVKPSTNRQNMNLIEPRQVNSEIPESCEVTINPLTNLGKVDNEQMLLDVVHLKSKSLNLPHVMSSFV